MARDTQGHRRGDGGDDQPTEYLRGNEPTEYLRGNDATEYLRGNEATQFLGEDSPTEYLGRAEDNGTRYLGESAGVPQQPAEAERQRPQQYFPPQQASQPEETRYAAGYAPGYDPSYGQPYRPAGDLSDYEATASAKHSGRRKTGLIVGIVVVLLLIGGLVFLLGRLTGGSGTPEQVTYTEVSTAVETVTEEPSEEPALNLPDLPSEIAPDLSEFTSNLPDASDVQGWVDSLRDRLTGGEDPTDDGAGVLQDGAQ